MYDGLFLICGTDDFTFTRIKGHGSFLDETAEEGKLSGSIILIEALNSSMVIDEIAEEGRLF